MEFKVEVEFEFIKREHDAKKGVTSFLWGLKEHPKAEECAVMCESIISNEFLEDLQIRRPDKELVELIWDVAKTAAARDLAYFACVGTKAEAASKEKK